MHPSALDPHCARDPFGSGFFVVVQQSSFFSSSLLLSSLITALFLLPSLSSVLPPLFPPHSSSSPRRLYSTGSRPVSVNSVRYLRSNAVPYSQALFYFGPLDPNYRLPHTLGAPPVSSSSESLAVLGKGVAGKRFVTRIDHVPLALFSRLLSPALTRLTH